MFLDADGDKTPERRPGMGLYDFSSGPLGGLAAYKERNANSYRQGNDLQQDVL